MKKDTLIFMGRSGSGKGTQIKLLKQYLRENYSDTHILHFESGDGFRNLIKNEGYTNDIIRNFVQSGKLVPDFITEWLLTDFVVQNFNGTQLLIFDGFPRTLKQAETMNALINYYKLKNVKIIDVHVSGSEVRKRMLSRGRSDDSLDLINTRIDWYDKHVAPAIDYFDGKENYEIIRVNGEKEVGGVFEEIKEKLNY